MMPALGADIQVIAQLAMKKHRAAPITFRPKFFWHLAARKDGIYPWTDVVVNPIHLFLSTLLLEFRDKMADLKLQSFLREFRPIDRSLLANTRLDFEKKV